MWATFCFVFKVLITWALFGIPCYLLHLTGVPTFVPWLVGCEVSLVAWFCGFDELWYPHSQNLRLR